MFVQVCMHVPNFVLVIVKTLYQRACVKIIFHFGGKQSLLFIATHAKLALEYLEAFYFHASSCPGRTGITDTHDFTQLYAASGI